MSQYIIIKGKVNSGKTTTCALLYEKLDEDGEKSFLLTSPLNKNLDKIKYNKKGNIMDFVSIHVLKGKVIVIISAGDDPKPLELKIDKLLNTDTMAGLIGEPYEVDIFVVCSRTQMRKNSTLEMLYNKIPEDLRKENGFIDEVKNEDLNAIDKFLNEENREKWNNIVSCLGKFAALIKPEVYAMYDTLAVKTMGELSNYKRSNLNTYQHYMSYFEALKREVEAKYGEIIKTSFDNFEEKYSEHSPINKNKSIAKEAYVNRAIDKLLWYRGKEEG